MSTGSPVGSHRVVSPAGALPQAADRLDPDPAIADDEARISVERLNLDAASYRQLHTAHGGDGERIRAEVLGIIERRGKMHNPATGSGGMLIGTVDAVGERSPLGLEPGQKIATLVSLTLTPLHISDGLARWDGLSEQVPAAGHAILFGRSIAAPLPEDLPEHLALAVLDVCGAPALVRRIVARRAHASTTVAVFGAAGKSGSLSLAAARDAHAAEVVAVVRDEIEAAQIRRLGTADTIVVADATEPIDVAGQVTGALRGRGADVTVVCVDVPGCEHGAILATAAGGTVVFFSMATSFTAAALGAEGLAADVEMLIGNGYVPGHAEYALQLMRADPRLRELFTARVGHVETEGR
ncbi:L-erythro-3,5-diaminohexanoate dehydrogenase [Glycomyces sp. TRM65418]|uniref:L-erythro-3,5-diaminohexanoate dehydrogenase n=1 Tax=Glycomyces sp. TRM65418 TaxID=2867006 RepID=UPI001CE585D6|nr:L-erythro-3,5-diaminohexanoate dehydrogenase [Glycomyces sp. TRM65418]MCC3765260.1 L-erythro-3,5-diaminohexanoate dehydrogenase [Glycomyces sp. TRM65418]QZD54881.1 L-erythro-3,5-diaminohexanoate dehydrogenase [Glycomyces sp. TRM65418]